MVVVAIGFVTEARSNRVDGVTRGEDISYVTRPKAFRATRQPWCVTAIDAAGKARCAMASSRMEKAEEKTSS